MIGAVVGMAIALLAMNILLPELRCSLWGLLTSIRYRALISGHRFCEIECSDPNLHILRCVHCNQISIAWRSREPKGWAHGQARRHQ